MNPFLRYQINYTVVDRNPIIVPRSSVVDNAVDVVLIGKNRLEYGEIFNTNVLHLLENFAAPEDPENPGNPYFEVIVAPLLQHPTMGQVWYNKTSKNVFVWNGGKWEEVGPKDHVSGNSGVIAHGQQLPRPEDSQGGFYDYEECSWVVSPFGMIDSDRIVTINCYADANAVVTMEYQRANDISLSYGLANYQIIAIEDNNNLGVVPSPSATPGLTPTATPTPTSSPTPTVTVTQGLSPTVTPTSGITATATPTVTPGLSPTGSPTATPTVTPGLSSGWVPPPTPTPTTTLYPTKTPGHTVTASVTPAVTLTNTPTISVTPTLTATNTPTPTVTPTVTPSSLPAWTIVQPIEEVILPSSSSTGKPCHPEPPPEECHIGTLGNEIEMVSECYVDSEHIRRTTTKYKCNLQVNC